MKYKFIPNEKKSNFFVIASNGFDWEHVSVSLPHRCPTWNEMCYIKSLFWEESDVAVQYHPAKKNYVNMVENCLHLWRHRIISFPEPPWQLVRLKDRLIK
jgi:hypothetical protein